MQDEGGEDHRDQYRGPSAARSVRRSSDGEPDAQSRVHSRLDKIELATGHFNDSLLGCEPGCRHPAQAPPDAPLYLDIQHRRS